MPDDTGQPTEREFLEGLRYEDKFPDVSDLESRLADALRERDEARERSARRAELLEVAKNAHMASEARLESLTEALREALYAIERWENDESLGRDHLDECDAHFLEYVGGVLRPALAAVESDRDTKEPPERKRELTRREITEQWARNHGGSYQDAARHLWGDG